MPRGDGTGPAGMGPMSGKGLGYCAGYAAPGGANFGFGPGRGRGFRRMYYATGFPGWARYGGYPQDFVNEKEFLQNQADLLQQQLNEVREQLKGMEKNE